MWIVLSAIATISLIAFFIRGRNAVWGGATIGLIVGIIVSLVGDGFNWSIIWKGIVIGALLGLVAELLGKLSDRLKRKE